jgi:hypothetical protein
VSATPILPRSALTTKSGVLEESAAPLETLLRRRTDVPLHGCTSIKQEKIIIKKKNAHCAGCENRRLHTHTARVAKTEDYTRTLRGLRKQNKFEIAPIAHDNA